VPIDRSLIRIVVSAQVVRSSGVSQGVSLNSVVEVNVS
jgi:hypothetical protein